MLGEFSVMSPLAVGPQSSSQEEDFFMVEATVLLALLLDWDRRPSATEDDLTSVPESPTETPRFSSIFLGHCIT